MNESIRDAQRKLEQNRGDWWLCRKDSDPKGKWTITADPYGGWDWRIYIGPHKDRAVRRLLATRDQEEESRKLSLIRAEKRKHISSLVDKMRTGASVTSVHNKSHNG